MQTHPGNYRSFLSQTLLKPQQVRKSSRSSNEDERKLDTQFTSSESSFLWSRVSRQGLVFFFLLLSTSLREIENKLRLLFHPFSLNVDIACTTAKNKFHWRPLNDWDNFHKTRFIVTFLSPANDTRAAINHVFCLHFALQFFSLPSLRFHDCFLVAFKKVKGRKSSRNHKTDREVLVLLKFPF